MRRIDAAVVGRGGRDHELARQLNGSDDINRIYVVGGNAGTEALLKAQNRDIKPNEFAKMVHYLDKKRPGLTIIGPEAPLAAGLADRLRAKGLVVFGPSQDAARLESSKAHATLFMEEEGIPHPSSPIVHNYRDAVETIRQLPDGSYVIKADGLAEGKGVFLPDTFNEAALILQNLFIKKTLGKAAETVLISNRYYGPELSVFVVSDGTKFTVLPFAKDYKRLKDGDEGPNTGGMGAFAPLPLDMVNPAQEQKINDIAERTINGMTRRGTPFQGVLYIGIMLAEELGGDPAVIEYNVRFGDPETQVVLPLLSEAGVDVVDMLRSAAEGNLRDISIPSHLGNSALTVCMAARDYPGPTQGGHLIRGIEEDYPGVIIHHGATRQSGVAAVTNGGRVLHITGIGETHDDASHYAYRAINNIHFTGEQHRTDIGPQART